MLSLLLLVVLLVVVQGADRMTVERVTRFYLGEFQTTLQRGGKYINELDADEEKALMRYCISIDSPGNSIP